MDSTQLSSDAEGTCRPLEYHRPPQASERRTVTTRSSEVGNRVRPAGHLLRCSVEDPRHAGSIYGV